MSLPQTYAVQVFINPFYLSNSGKAQIIEVGV